MTEIADPLNTRRIFLVCRDQLGDELRITGREDAAIRSSSRTRYETLRRRLPEPSPSTWLVRAPSRQVQQTASRIFPDATWEENEHLAERDYGLWQGRRWEEVRNEQPRKCEHFWTNYAGSRPPDGESVDDVLYRIEIFVTSALHRDDWRDLVVITHPELTRLFICAAIQLEPKHALRVGVEPLGLTRLSHTWMGWQLECLNVQS